MVPECLNRILTFVFIITFPITFIIFTVFPAYGGYESKKHSFDIFNNQYKFDKYIIDEIGMTEHHMSIYRYNFFTTVSNSFEDDNNQGFTKITNTVKYNEFSADSLPEAINESKIPERDSQGLTLVRYNSSWYEDSKDIITRAEFFVSIEIQLPLWTNIESQCSKVKTEWYDFINELWVHEEKHKEIFEEYYNDIHQKVIGKSAEEVIDTILPRWNKTILLNDPAKELDLLHEDYHHKLEGKGLQPIPVDTSISC